MKKIIAICITATALIFSACNKDKALPSYVGKWQKGGTTLELKENKTYTLIDTLSMYAGSGNYQVAVTAADELLLTGIGDSICSDTTVGNYTFKHRVNSDPGVGTFYRNLTINLVSDGCIDRGNTVSGIYVMQEE